MATGNFNLEPAFPLELKSRTYAYILAYSFERRSLDNGDHTDNLDVLDICCTRQNGRVGVNTAGSRYSAWENHINPDVRLGGNLKFFSVSHVNFFVGGAKVYSQTGWGGHDRIPSGFATGS